MQEDGLEGHLASELQPHHDHPGNPEEENVMPCFQHAGGVEAGQVWGGLGVLGPPQGTKWPQPR